MATLPRVLADLPVSPAVTELLAGRAELVPWSAAGSGHFDAVYTYGHPTVDAPFCDRLPGVRVISNFGVGVDHIDVAAAAARAASPSATRPASSTGRPPTWRSPCCWPPAGGMRRGRPLRPRPRLHALRPVATCSAARCTAATLGIIGLGRIGEQVAKRARGFGMTVLYHNRHRRPDAEGALGAQYASKDELLASADYVVLTRAADAETRGLIGRRGAGEDEADGRSW